MLISPMEYDEQGLLTDCRQVAMSLSVQAAQPCLERLPVELIEQIAVFLELYDLWDLRLVCRALAAKASQGHFKKYFRQKEIGLPEYEQSGQLKKFRLLTQQSGFGCFIEKLTLIRYVPFDSEDFVQTRSHRSLLSACFSNLKANSRLGCLQELVLDVNPPKVEDSDRRVGWKHAWSLAGALFQDTMTALHESGLPVLRLSLFASIAGVEDLCCLAFDQLASCLQETPPSRSLATLKGLSMRISDSMALPATQDSEAVTSNPYSHISQLETLFKLCPCLDSLDFHYFKIWIKQSEILREERHFFSRIADSLSFPNLKSCTLRGIDCGATSLVAMVEKAPRLRHIKLIDMHLTSGLFRPVFDILAARELDSIHLEGLWQVGRVYFVGIPGESRFPSTSRRRMGPNELTRKRPDTKLKIEYQVSQGRPYDSPELRRDRERRKRLYGPIR